MKGLFLSFFAMTSLFAARPMNQGPVHEAMIAPENGFVVLEAVSTAPPAAIDEKKPEQTNSGVEWIPGYWAWADGEYIWVSGVWRKAPPDRQWIGGYWKQMEKNGWVRIAGFWSDTEENQLKSIAKPPPAPVQQPVTGSVAQDQYWIPGQWEYNASSEDYSWHDGRWERQDPDWVYMSGQYRWRPEGYVYVSGYWDYPLEQRGIAYAPVSPDRTKSYTPSIVLGADDIVMSLFPYYPEYLCFFQHHYHYHHDWWANFWGTPPWWQWNDWWELTWKNQWALFWWWTHPGYPQPEWLTLAVSEKIQAPSKRLTDHMKKVVPPAVVTPSGVVEPNALIKTLKNADPILPANAKARGKVERKVRPGGFRRLEKLRPTGVGADQIPATPDIEPDAPAPSQGRVQLPPRPKPIYGVVEPDQPALERVVPEKSAPVQEAPSAKRPQWKDLPPEAEQQLSKPKSAPKPGRGNRSGT